MIVKELLTVQELKKEIGHPIDQFQKKSVANHHTKIPCCYHGIWVNPHEAHYLYQKFLKTFSTSHSRFEVVVIPFGWDDAIAEGVPYLYPVAST
ncbi:hypothetical protein EVAR_86573_1 [Eumeta japonica]|uniref:Uncharacterized protein n=1 Tax=Eumeta variegata TaxID=151549 RepID=A0A4C1W2P4_EUMVA|nr:hypothetical protein EVAR_86573_1 [Eumeta japonica]